MIRISKIRLHIVTLFVFFSVIYTNFSFYTLIVFACALIHELGHIFYLSRIHAQIFEINILPFGVDIVYDNSHLTYKKELYTALFGPIFNFFSALIFFIAIKIDYSSLGLFAFFSNLLLGIINLMPIKTLDGGKALECLLCRYLSLYTALKICRITSGAFLIVFLFFSLFMLSATGFNVSFLFICIYLFFCIYIKGTKEQTL